MRQRPLNLQFQGHSEKSPFPPTPADAVDQADSLDFEQHDRIDVNLKQFLRNPIDRNLQVLLCEPLQAVDRIEPCETRHHQLQYVITLLLGLQSGLVARPTFPHSTSAASSTRPFRRGHFTLIPISPSCHRRCPITDRREKIAGDRALEKRLEVRLEAPSLREHDLDPVIAGLHLITGLQPQQAQAKTTRDGFIPLIPPLIPPRIPPRIPGTLSSAAQASAALCLP